jgi:hypothetical protein
MRFGPAGRDEPPVGGRRRRARVEASSVGRITARRRVKVKSRRVVRPVCPMLQPASTTVRSGGGPAATIRPEWPRRAERGLLRTVRTNALADGTAVDRGSMMGHAGDPSTGSSGLAAGGASGGTDALTLPLGDRVDRRRRSAVADAASWLLPGSLVALLALAVRAHGIESEGLWYDEVYSATFAVQSWFDALVSVWRFDVHPPLYFLQLHLWALLGTSTVWLFWNSVAWGVAASVSLYVVARRRISPAVATIAAIVFAVMPADVLYAHQLRMYAMLDCLVIWAWYCTDGSLDEDAERRTTAGLIATELAIAYTHASGVVIVFVVCCYALLRMAVVRPSRQAMRRWLVANVVVAVGSLPALADVMVRSVSHTTAPGLRDVASTVAFLILGPATRGSDALQVVALVLFVAILGAAFTRAGRVLVPGLVVLPLTIVFAISHVLRPMWVDRALLFVTPFLATALALSLHALGDVARRRLGADDRRWPAVAVGGAVVVLLAGLSFRVFDAFEKKTRFREAAGMISAGLLPGDVVFVPENVTYWGIAWYLVGPRWGTPLDVQDPDPAMQSRSATWTKVLTWLGPDNRRRLHLEPRTRAVSFRGAPVIVGWSTPPEIATAPRVWLVNRHGADGEWLTLPGFAELEHGSFAGLEVQLLAPPRTGR